MCASSRRDVMPGMALDLIEPYLEYWNLDQDKWDDLLGHRLGMIDKNLSFL